MFSWLRAPPIANDNYFSSSSLTKKTERVCFYSNQQPILLFENNELYLQDFTLGNRRQS